MVYDSLRLGIYARLRFGDESSIRFVSFRLRFGYVSVTIRYVSVTFRLYVSEMVRIHLFISFLVESQPKLVVGSVCSSAGAGCG